MLLITLVLYYGPWINGRHAKAWQIIVALLASVLFYGWEDPKLLGLLAISCVGNSVATARIILHKVQGDEDRVRYWVKLAVILNLLLLAIFKYLPFVAGMIPFLPEGWVQGAKEIPLPIGISFYTFHGISMIVDVARGEVTRESNVMLSRGSRFAKGVRDIGFYLLFFPQLVAGPIVKAKQFWPQISAKRWSEIPWNHVVHSLILGFFLKMVIADNLAEQTVILTKPWITALGPVDLVCLLYGYSLQIFADFAGYSLIAIGLAALFGYQFPINFNFPYLSTSITEFWRRWHMSLSAWLRDYLYIPLGGNRSGEMRTYINLFVVMFLGGLWHGSEWKFALWGISHGMFLGLERYFGRKHNQSHKKKAYWVKVIGWFYTFHVVTLLWLTFLMPDIAQIKIYFSELSIPQRITGPTVFVPLFFGSFAVIYHIWGWLREHSKMDFSSPKIVNFRAAAFAIMLYLIITNSGAPQGFIYFQF